MLHPDWKQAWKWWSVQSMALVTAALATWGALPDDLKAALPPNLIHWISIFVLTMGMIGRINQQHHPDSPDQDNHGQPP